jgi:hypothetical protein
MAARFEARVYGRSLAVTEISNLPFVSVLFCPATGRSLVKRSPNEVGFTKIGSKGVDYTIWRWGWVGGVTAVWLTSFCLYFCILILYIFISVNENSPSCMFEMFLCMWDDGFPRIPVPNKTFGMRWQCRNFHTGITEPTNPKIPITGKELNPEYKAGNLIAQWRCAVSALGVFMSCYSSCQPALALLTHSICELLRVRHCILQ